jgi:hypothetical protein
LKDDRLHAEASARVHLQVVDKYEHDWIIADTDTTMLADALDRIVFFASHTLFLGRFRGPRPPRDSSKR